MTKLTKKSADAIKEPGRYGDQDGLYLVVGRPGAKSWLIRIVVNGRRRDIGLGSFKDVALAQARGLAAQTRRLVREGRDPVAERRRASGMPTFEEAARRVHETTKPNWREGVHLKQWLSSLENDVFPKIGSRPISSVAELAPISTGHLGLSREAWGYPRAQAYVGGLSNR